ncbi:MAG TPA: MBL fold metallo-hydrolase [Anaerolineae bacterium]|nr:MBL fold metallo-hydrolase [Anaerolineae bacterium]
MELDDSGWPEALPRPGNRNLHQLPSVSPWFSIYQVSVGTYALLEPHHYEEVISYLIVGSDLAILFDTGMGIGNILAEVKRLTDKPVVVVNSHSHYDHVGDNHRFRQVWAYDDSGEIAYIERGVARADCVRFLSPGLYRDLPPGFDPAAYEIRPSPVARRLRHLEAIRLGSRTLTVYHTPGHSPGSICLWDDRDGLLFTGDTVYPGTLYAHFEDSDLPAYRQTTRCLTTLVNQVSHLCPAHNEALISKELLGSVADAFQLIASGMPKFERVGDTRVYRFAGFGIAVRAN